MKIVIACSSFIFLLVSCHKEKNVEEFEQFKGTWNLSNVSTGIFNHSDKKSFIFSKTENVPINIGLKCIIKNDGFISFDHDTDGNEKFRIRSKTEFYFEWDSINTLGYVIEVKTKLGKTFYFVIAKHVYSSKILATLWIKNANYNSKESIYESEANSNTSESVSYLQKFGNSNITYQSLGEYEKN